MPLKDVVIAALSRPAGRVVEAPVRDLIDEALKDRGYASPADLARLEGEIGSLRAQVQGLPGKLSTLEADLTRIGAEAAALREALGRAELAASEARARAEQAEARAEQAQTRVAELEQKLAGLAGAAPAVAAGPSSCKVDGCARHAAERGFCRAHLLAWKAGRLAGFVSPEGLLALGAGAGQVALALAGQPYREAGGQVLVAGAPVSVRGL